MEESKQTNKSNGTGCAIVFFIIFLLIFVPILIGLISNNMQVSNQAKHEKNLLEQGKTKSHNDVINEIIETLKNKNEAELKEFLSKDFLYYDNNNIEHKYISSFLEDLKILSSSYDIEQRGNDIKDQETYRIYWNVVEQNKSLGRANQYYCLQKVTVILNRVVKDDIITYEIEKIILTDN